ncbi:hypothetical protein EYZ11_010166 [Aspergillus tanneri]|uniref:Uncharacterized protein n=1 Tax=Aspergillus tanneri TaxID=1220188 RepID=A0A4S3J6B5_9EURO|nr:uncharacterized protein ATNIH1004_011712 [Aspergillus tanneri]KAA8641576.1 hypothetical protein ATNIH1004_011712 [Aspergillus tanneri]THC90365.1 hypothetical protein EYZ11_010166 [Aspergillus tanneri]
MLPSRLGSADSLTPRTEILASLRQFVDKFCAVIHDLCDKAPSVAEAIARVIQERVRSRTCPDSPLSKRRPLRNQDPSYRPSKFVKRESAVCDAEPDSLDAESVDENPRSENVKSSDSSADEGLANSPTGTPAPIGSPAEASTDPMQSTQHEVRGQDLAAQLSAPDHLFMAIPSVRDLILHTTRTLHRLAKYQDGVPANIHKRIVLTLQGENPEALASLPCDQWSDGSMWVQILMRGYSHRSRVTILNMLEYMGAWEWYDAQVRSMQNAQATAQGQPAGRRGAAIKVLDRITPRGKWISGIGRVIPEQDEITSPAHTNLSDSEIGEDS